MSRFLRLVLSMVLAASLLPVLPAAFAADAPYEHDWLAESMVGGDRGGSSVKSVLDSAASMTRDGTRYEGTVTYSDRLAIKDPSGEVLVQVARIRLELTGAPAAGGTAIAGTFMGTVDIEEYHGVTLEQGTTGELPAWPAGTSTYSVTGHWGARMRGDAAAGEILYETATRRSGTGEATPRDATWFTRPEGAEKGAQTFAVKVVGATGSGPVEEKGGISGAIDAIRRGAAGTEYRRVLPITAEAAARARALRDAKPVGAQALPAGSISIDLDVAGQVLDAKNRAAGLHDKQATAPIQAAAAVWKSERAKPSARKGSTPTFVLGVLGGLVATPGALQLIDRIKELSTFPASSLSTETVAMLDEWSATVQSLTRAHAPVFRDTAAVAEAVRDLPIPQEGPLADAILAAADDPHAPEEALVVTRFARDKASDNGPALDLESAVGRALGRITEKRDGLPVVSWTGGAGAQRIWVATWLGYRRADGRVFLLGGDNGPIALTDGSLLGWAYAERRAYVVDSKHAGRLLGVLPAETSLPFTPKKAPSGAATKPGSATPKQP